ncbi:MAG: polyprenyl synthetase family protein [Alphaproteobacteria bacterium]|nr:polyprenyl synthetase family protein [Alphaproteobacteria bacterium]
MIVSFASGQDEFTAALAEIARETEVMLARLLPVPEGPEARLFEAMRYATLGGGKRFRPFLVVASSALFGVSRQAALRVAAAVEMLHAYSLVHDDLPCMDDDDFRRGQPTVHKAFDEATAVLVGDSLLTLAFEVLADEQTHGDPKVRAELVQTLARAGGGRGMTGGQMLDLLAAHQPLDEQGVTRLQRMKTGALIEFCCLAGAVLGKASPPLRHALIGYGRDLGFAFQIADDLLDVTGRPEEVGKKTGKDGSAGKATLVAMLGVEGARATARRLADQAKDHLGPFEARAELLRQAVEFVITRRN